MAEKPCLSCGKPITFKESTTRVKDDGTPAWDRFNPDGSPHIDERKNGGGGYRGKTPEEQRAIVRQSALKSAVAFASARMAAGDPVTSADVMKVADAFVAWLEKA
jgi:hypothetical protein